MASCGVPSRIAGPEDRRSTRLAIAIPITISGKDDSGESFRENVHTLVVNTHGAKIATFHRLNLGTEIRIDNPALVRSVRASVVWLGKKPSPSGANEVGVQLLHAQNIWGIEFPPDDWQAELPAGGGSLETTKNAPPAGTRLVAAPGAARAQARPGEHLSSATARPTAPAVAKGAEAGSPGQSVAAADGALCRFNQLAAEAVERHSVLFTERLGKVMSQLSSQVQTRLQEEAHLLQEKTIRTIEQEVYALTARLQSTYGKVGALLTKSNESEKIGRAELGRIDEKLKELTRQALQETLEELRARARKDLDTLAADFVKQLRQLLEQQLHAQVEATRRTPPPASKPRRQSKPGDSRELPDSSSQERKEIAHPADCVHWQKLRQVSRQGGTRLPLCRCTHAAPTLGSKGNYTVRFFR